MSRIKHPQRRRKKANRIFRKRRKVFFEPLEPRLLLSETFSFAAATAAAGMDMTLKLTDDNLADVVRICRLVDGMPLAILLASAWVEMLTPPEIAAELGLASTNAARMRVSRALAELAEQMPR